MFEWIVVEKDDPNAAVNDSMFSGLSEVPRAWMKQHPNQYAAAARQFFLSGHFGRKKAAKKKVLVLVSQEDMTAWKSLSYSDGTPLPQKAHIGDMMYDCVNVLGMATLFEKLSTRDGSYYLQEQKWDRKLDSTLQLSAPFMEPVTQPLSIAEPSDMGEMRTGIGVNLSAANEALYLDKGKIRTGIGVNLSAANEALYLDKGKIRTGIDVNLPAANEERHLDKVS